MGDIAREPSVGESNGVVRMNGAGIISREEFHAKDREAFLAGEDLDDNDVSSSKSKSKARVVEDDEDDDRESGVSSEIDDDDDEDDVDAVSDDDEDEDLDDDDEDLDDEEDEDDADDAATAKSKAKLDPEDAKRVRLLEKQEKRMRADIARERDSFERERQAFVAEWQPRVEQAEKLQKLLDGAKNPYKVIELLSTAGMSEDDLFETAQVLFAHSSKGKTDPKNREAIAHRQTLREMREELAELRRRDADRAANEQKAAEQAAADRELDAYLTRVTKKTTDETPLMKRYLDKSPTKAREAIERATARLARKLGALPKPAAVLRAAEKERRRELRDMGVDVDTIIKAAPTDAKNGATKKGDKKVAAAKTISDGDGEKPKLLSGRALRDDIVAHLVSDDLD